MKRRVLTYPNKKLREISNMVDFPLSQNHSNAIKDMIDTFPFTDGIALAAPQIGHNIRVILMDIAKIKEAEGQLIYKYDYEPLIMVNPEVIYYRGEITEGWEQCLSIPGVTGMVPRNSEAGVAYRNVSGELSFSKFYGFSARVFAHEYDHLEGILFTDRSIKTQPVYQNLQA